MADGVWLDNATSTYPAVVLGYVAAQKLGITSVADELRVRINDIWNGREPYTAMQRLGFEMIRKSFIAGGESTSRFRSSRIREQRRGASNVGCVEADRSGASFPDVPRRRRSRVRAGEDRVRARWGRCHQAGARRRQGVGCRPGDGCAAPFVSS
jgi:hypothetical protein